MSPLSKNVVASVAGESVSFLVTFHCPRTILILLAQAYYNLLDSQCPYFKKTNIGWFTNIYSDHMEPEYRTCDNSWNMKFAFKPKTSY
jgi:hypothetical protein